MKTRYTLTEKQWAITHEHDCPDPDSSIGFVDRERAAGFDHDAIRRASGLKPKSSGACNVIVSLIRLARSSVPAAGAAVSALATALIAVVVVALLSALGGTNPGAAPGASRPLPRS